MRGRPAEPPASAEAVVLTFTCPHCAMELSVPAGLAGVRGPCPGCGAGIRAPSATRGARAIDIKPRLRKSRREEENGRADTSLPSGGGPSASPSEAGPSSPFLAAFGGPAENAPASRSGRKGKAGSRPSRSLDPNTAFSQSDTDRKELRTIVKIAVAFLLTAVVVLSTLLFLKSEFSKEDPPPLFEDEFSF